MLDPQEAWEGRQWPKPIVYRPTVYKPLPYSSGPRHEFLTECLKSMNPRILQRTLDREMRRPDPLLHHRDPPFLPLQEALPNTYAPHLDDFRAEEAFLRRKMPKLRRELSGDRKTRTRALFTLADVVHDPERVTEAVRQHIPRKLTQIMFDKRHPWVRERCLAALETMAGTAVGRDAILLEPQCLHHIKVLMLDREPAVRFRAALALRMLVFFRLGPYDMDERSLAPYVLYVARFEQDSCIIAVLLFSLKLLLELTETKEFCIRNGAFETMDFFMRSEDADLAAAAMLVMARLASCATGEKIADRRRFVHSVALRRHLFSDNLHVANAAAMFLMYLTLSQYGKICAAQNDLQEALFLLVARPDCWSCQIVAFQALCNMCEYPPCKKRLLELDEEFQTMRIDDEDVKRFQIRLLALMHWVD